MTDIAPGKFDYSQLEERAARSAKDRAVQIRRLGRQTTEHILEIGRHLTHVKNMLPHGQWGPWLKTEFAWTDRQARRFMQAHEVFGRKTDTMSDLDHFIENIDATSLYRLAAPSTPEEAREEVMAKAETSEKVTPKEVKAIVQKHKQPAPASKISKDAARAVGARITAEALEQGHVIALHGIPPEVGEVINLSAVKHTAVGLSYLTCALQWLEKAREALDRADDLPPEIYDHLRKLTHALKEELYRRQTGHAPRTA